MSLEKELLKDIRLTKIRRAILGTVQAAGIITIAVMAPNVAGILGRSMLRNRDSVRTSVNALIERGLLKRTSDGIQLTDLGRQYIDRKLARPIRPRKWDGKWRIVIFDVPERRRRARDVLRGTLNRIGFYKLQASVWVYPYDCEELVTLLKSDYSLGKEVLYMIADKLEGDYRLKRVFSLTR